MNKNFNTLDDIFTKTLNGKLRKKALNFDEAYVAIWQLFYSDKLTYDERNALLEALKVHVYERNISRARYMTNSDLLENMLDAKGDAYSECPTTWASEEFEALYEIFTDRLQLAGFLPQDID